MGGDGGAGCGSLASPPPSQGLLHNASDLVDALWVPGEGSLYGHVNLGDVAAAAGTGDPRSLADAYLPPHRGRALPSLATFYNVGLLGDGAIVSLDALLRVRAFDDGGGAPCALLPLPATAPPLFR